MCTRTHQTILFIFGAVCESIIYISNSSWWSKAQFDPLAYLSCNRYVISVLCSSHLKLTFWGCWTFWLSTSDVLLFEKTHIIYEGAFKAKWFVLVPPSLSAASLAAAFDQPFCLAASFPARPSVSSSHLQPRQRWAWWSDGQAGGRRERWDEEGQRWRNYLGSSSTASLI